jgi:trans-aconitate methyltransferase
MSGVDCRVTEAVGKFIKSSGCRDRGGSIVTAPESTSFHALRFGRSASRYEAQAGVQARMAEALLSLWGERPAPACILEFGCGTGLLTRRLRARFPAAATLATDASAEMIHIARAACSPDHQALEAGPVQFSTLDARGSLGSLKSYNSLTSTMGMTDPVDLVVSGALVQWFADLASHFRFAATVSAPGAVYLVSGFDRANFPELNALLAEPPFSYQNFPGHSQADVEAAADAAGWRVEGYLTWDDREVLPTARAVLQRMQDLGSVRDPREGGRMTRGNLAHLLTEYEGRFSVAEPRGGVRLTWKPWAAILVKH